MTVPFFLFYMACTIVIASIGRNYRFGFWGFFFASLFFSPLVACLMVIAAKPLEKPSSKC